MKYLVILIIAIIMVRIDVLISMVEKAATKVSKVQENPAPEIPDTVKAPDLIPVDKDSSLKQTPKKTFLALLEDFHANPIGPIRERAMSIFKDHPTMFTQKLDPELETHIFSWRDLLNNNEPEVINFLLDLMNVLQGENLEMVKRFFSLWMEINMENFISAYSRTKDSNCSIAKTFGYQILEEEKATELYERQDALRKFMTKEKIEPAQKALATNCLLVLQIEISKLPPVIDENSEQPEAQAQPSEPVIAPVPSDQGGVSP